MPTHPPTFLIARHGYMLNVSGGLSIYPFMLSITATPLDTEIIQRGYEAASQFMTYAALEPQVRERPLPDNIGFDGAVFVRLDHGRVGRNHDIGNYDVIAHRDAFKILTEWMYTWTPDNKPSILCYAYAAEMTHQYLDSRIREHDMVRNAEPLSAFPNADTHVIATGCNAVGDYATPADPMIGNIVIPTEFITATTCWAVRKQVRVKLPGEQCPIPLNLMTPAGAEDTGELTATWSAADRRDRLALAVVTMFAVWKRHSKAYEVRDRVFDAFEELSKYAMKAGDADK